MRSDECQTPGLHGIIHTTLRNFRVYMNYCVGVDLSHVVILPQVLLITTNTMTPAEHGVNDHHELSPLLISSASSVTTSTDIGYEEVRADDGEASSLSSQRNSGSATVLQTMVNLAKACMGTGCLALPFAAQQGGLLLFIFGTYGIAVWNCYAVQRLCQSSHKIHPVGPLSPSKHALPASATRTTQDHDSNVEDDPPPLSLHPVAAPPGTATLGKVAWYALGPVGLIMVDVMLVTLLLGIIVTYQDAMQSFLHDTIFTTGQKAIDAMIVAMIVAPLSVVPDMGYLAKASAFGLTILGLALAVIAGNGILLGHSNNHDDATTSLYNSLDWRPREGLTGISRWFGCLVFGFGVVPLTFNFQESMREPTKMIQATNAALFGVASLYIGIGIFLSFLYPNIPGDVLHELPPTGAIPTLTRLAMVLVILATTPLLIVPCGELLEGKIQHQLSLQGDGRISSHVGTRHGRPRRPTSHETEQFVKIVVRFGISFTTAAISVGIPGFVDALSFVGCFCVALVSFCIPPFLHFVLLLRSRRCKGWNHYAVDATMLAWGLAATCITTITTLHKLARETSAPSVS
jgi:amino acid permease